MKLLLLATVVLVSSLGQARSTQFQFPDCVDDCIERSGCGTNSPRCLCVNARMNFMVQVVNCMSRKCKDELESVGSDFLDVMVQGCSMAKMPIPADKVSGAAMAAASLGGLLPSVTMPPPGPTAQPSKPTSQSRGPSLSAPTNTQASSTSAQSDTSTDRGNSPETTSQSAPTPVPVPGPNTDSLFPSVFTTFLNPPPPSEPTDSSPFATPNDASDRSLARAGALVPIVAAVLGFI